MKPIIRKENVKTLFDSKFIHVFDLQYEEGKHYYDASRRPLDKLMAIKSDEEAKTALPDAVTCFVILKIKGEEPKLLLARETIYKEEVDMILEGKKTEEIVALMDEKEKARKAKEEKLRKQKSQQQKLDSFKKKIAEGENLLKMGIISQEELDVVKKECAEFEKSLKAEVEAENIDAEVAVEAQKPKRKATTASKTEKSVDKTAKKVDNKTSSEKKTTSKSVRTKKNDNKQDEES